MGEKNKLGLKKTSSIEDYLGNWIVVNSKTGGALAGYLMDSDTKNILLMPYQEIDFDDNGFQNARIVEEGIPYSIPKDDVGPAKAVSRKSVENNCTYMNRKFQNEAMQNEKQNQELRNYFNQGGGPSQLDILYKGSRD